MVKRDSMAERNQLVCNVMQTWFLEKPTKIEPLNGQSPNYGWKITYKDIHYVLRKCVRNHYLPWLKYLETLTSELIQRDYPIQNMIESFKGERTVLYNGCFWQLRPFIEGRFHQMGSETDEQEVIKNMIQLHSMKNLPKGPPNPNCQLFQWIYQPKQSLKATGNALLQCTDEMRGSHLFAVYERELKTALEVLTPEIYEKLPVSLTHGDFHANNLLYNGSNLIMVLDFDTVEFRPRIYDVAVAAYLLTRVKRGAFKLDMSRTAKFINSYSVECNLSEYELRSITPLIQLLYLPTARYLNMLRKESPHLLAWYLEWSFDALISVRKQLNMDCFL
ncbi:phosphotransferase enzyme family protein [Bacillus cereus group sp. N21]|uniref:phosphotransferase enzyme family protein n=1 Tax=Bacillus cereus group sp. N21 TaxID=2794591 RepID=UPI0018F27D84|nr:phosphotransferase [Bacillus cereus group sp. N21]MBJ8030412.1 phosphotransferase [Bacillus cereus group sp. N21]